MGISPLFHSPSPRRGLPRHPTHVHPLHPEPGFFRTDLLGPRSVVFGDLVVEGHDSPAAVKAQWQAYHHNQSGDPAKLGEALVQLAVIESPPKQLFAGSDAVSGITADLQARLAEVQVHKDLSAATDGNFQIR